MLSQVVCRSTCHTASTTLSCLHMQTSRKTPQPFETVQITIFLISFYQHVANTFETKTKKIKIKLKIQINNKNWKNLLVSIFMCIHSNTKYIFHQFYYNGLRFCRILLTMYSQPRTASTMTPLLLFLIGATSPLSIAFLIDATFTLVQNNHQHYQLFSLVFFLIIAHNYFHFRM